LAKNWSKRGPLLFPFTKKLDIPKASQNVSKMEKFFSILKRGGNTFMEKEKKCS
jgi:hypothetical protein